MVNPLYFPGGPGLGGLSRRCLAATVSPSPVFRLRAVRVADHDVYRRVNLEAGVDSVCCPMGFSIPQGDNKISVFRNPGIAFDRRSSAVTRVIGRKFRVFQAVFLRIAFAERVRAVRAPRDDFGCLRRYKFAQPRIKALSY